MSISKFKLYIFSYFNQNKIKKKINKYFILQFINMFNMSVRFQKTFSIGLLKVYYVVYYE